MRKFDIILSILSISILLTKLLTHIKQGLQKYCETAYSRSGVNQMWILKNSKELLEHLQSQNFNDITSIMSFDVLPFTQPFLTRSLKADSQLSFETLLFTKMEIADTNFWFYVAKDPHFVKEHSDPKNKYTEDDIINMLECLVDNIFVVFGGNVSNRKSVFQWAQIVPLS